ncbi:MAG: 50S ribosomal protein L9 [Chlamydiae bacterium]|nr:50S ribosomal protein L9 [Chlamydiota bacterium]
MKNQLLLLEDIHNVGRKGDLVRVKPGYARNFLLPQQKALVADKSVVKIQARLKEERAKQSILDKKDSEDIAQKLRTTVVTQIVKVDAEGHMYGSVTAKDLVDLLQAEGISIERRMVSLEHPIRQIGVHTVNLKLKEGVQAHFNLKVEPEEGSAVLTQQKETKVEVKEEAPSEDVEPEDS